MQLSAALQGCHLTPCLQASWHGQASAGCRLLQLAGFFSRFRGLQGTIGLGSGKASELAAAVAKANARALKTLFYVPRFCASTIHQSRTAKFGRAKVVMYPRSTGAGICASRMNTAICRLAGIRDIGIKVHLVQVALLPPDCTNFLSGSILHRAKTPSPSPGPFDSPSVYTFISQGRRTCSYLPTCMFAAHWTTTSA